MSDETIFERTGSISSKEATEVTPKDIDHLINIARSNRPNGVIVFNLGSDRRSPFATEESDTVFNIDPTEAPGLVKTGLNDSKGIYYSVDAQSGDLIGNISPNNHPDIITVIAPNPRDILSKRNTMLEDIKLLSGPKTKIVIVLETESNELTRIDEQLGDEGEALQRIERRITKILGTLHEHESLDDALHSIRRHGSVNTRMSYAEDTEGQFLVLAK